MESIYICPKKECYEARLEIDDKSYVCSCGARYTYAAKYPILIFEQALKNSDEFNLKEASERDNNHLAYLFKTYNTSNEDFRKKISAPLCIKKNDKVLITAAGSGHDIPFIAEKLQYIGEIYVQDFSLDMLEVAVKNCEHLQSNDLKIYFSVSDAVNLPFSSNFFDAVYHYGGINFFSSVQKGIAEMVRVVKDKGSVVFGDEGLAPWLRDTEYGKMVIENNPLYNYKIPLHLLPQNIRDVQVTWTLEHVHYLIAMKKDDAFPCVNTQIEHLGIRGGSMYTRFYGKLEGINPILREKLYEKARKEGLSRVQLLENIIKSHLEE